MTSFFKAVVAQFSAFVGDDAVVFCFMYLHFQTFFFFFLVLLLVLYLMVCEPLHILAFSFTRIPRRFFIFFAAAAESAPSSTDGAPPPAR